MNLRLVWDMNDGRLLQVAKQRPTLSETRS